METIDLLNALSELGVLGAVLIGGSGVWFVLRRRNGNGQANNVIELLLEHEGRIATSLERMVSIHERSEERLRKLEEGQDELVKIHTQMEARREALGAMVDKGGHT